MSKFKEGTLVRIIDYSGFSARTVARFRGRVCIVDSDQGKFARVRLYNVCPTEPFQCINVSTKRLVLMEIPAAPARKALAPEFGPVPESGVTTVHSIGEMLPYQVYACVITALGRVHPRQIVKYLMRCSTEQAQGHVLWVYTSTGWLSDTVPLHLLDRRVGVDLTSMLGSGVYKLVPVYDYPAMSSDMNAARNVLIWSLDAQA